LAIVFIASNGCISWQDWGPGIRGEGDPVTETWDLDDFSGITLSFSGDVMLQQGETQSVKIEAQPNILDNISQTVSNGSWDISFKKRVRHHDGVKIWITLPSLTEAELAGSGSIKGEKMFENLDRVKLEISGSGDISLNLDAREIQAGITGSGDMRLRGKAAKSEIEITGSGHVDAEGLEAKDCAVEITGSGDADVNALEKLDAVIVGSGNVSYSGAAAVRSKVTGSGEVYPR
jgi:hypothetical protein